MVLDTSIAIKWIKQINETDSEKAYSLYQQLQAGEINIAVPDLILYEIANYASRQTEDIFSACLDFIEGIFESKIEIVPADKYLIQESAILGHNLKISAYDAVYLCLAKKYETKLITADRKLLLVAPELTISL